MSSSDLQYEGSRRAVRWALLPALIALVAAFAMPAGASAASCPVTPGVFATAWIGGDGNLGAENWTNGTPTGSCDVTIASPGSDVITMTGGANMKSLTLGGIGSTPHLIISDQSPNTNLDAQPAGITIAAGASVTLTCLPGGCPGGGPDIYSGSSPFSNAGTITVDANTGGGAVVGGVITNTGTIAFENSGGSPYSASLAGKVTNQGVITVADGGNVINQGSSCGGTEPFVKNDVGGTINGVGTGTLSVINFEQGDGITEDVFIPCGSLKYSGNGTSIVKAGGGFSLTGEMQVNQALTVSAESNNTNAVLQGDFTNNGDITLTCPEGGCSGSGGGPGGGVGFNANGHVFTNAGSFTFAAKSGTDAGTSGGMTNTGTIQFDQSGFLGDVVTNQGTISVANGKTAISPTGHCGNSTPRVINDTGGKIVGSGTGTLRAANFEQGAGTTAGSTPVTVDCGALKYIGSGASAIRVNTSATMTGGPSAGQTLTIAGQLNSAAFTNAGTIVLDQSTGNPYLNSAGVTNTGRIETSGASANTSSLGGQIDQNGAGAEVVVPAGTKLQLNNPPLLLKAGTLSGGGTIAGSVENSGGVVEPGASPGTLTLSGNYIQGAGGMLEIEIEGTGAGQYDSLALGGSANLDGTLALIPTDSFLASAAIGDSLPSLTYGGSATGQFAQTTVNPALSCGKVFATSLDEGAKTLNANVVAGNPCPSGGGGGGGGGGGQAGPPPIPNTKIGIHPGAKIFTKKAKLKVKVGFSSDVAGATFECKLDKGPYKPCRSPKSFKVKPGKHKLSVRAVGPGGTDATPAITKFRVIRQKG